MAPITVRSEVDAMPNVIQLKDGKLLIAFEIRDVLEVVENYIGQETRKYIEEYLEENIQDTKDFETQLTEYEKEIDQMGDHKRHILCDVLEEMDASDGLLQEQRLNRKRILDAVNNIRQIVKR